MQTWSKCFLMLKQVWYHKNLHCFKKDQKSRFQVNAFQYARIQNQYFKTLIPCKAIWSKCLLISLAKACPDCQHFLWTSSLQYFASTFPTPVHKSPTKESNSRLKWRLGKQTHFFFPRGEKISSSNCLLACTEGWEAHPSNTQRTSRNKIRPKIKIKQD